MTMVVGQPRHRVRLKSQEAAGVGELGGLLGQEETPEPDLRWRDSKSAETSSNSVWFPRRSRCRASSRARSSRFSASRYLSCSIKTRALPVRAMTGCAQVGVGTSGAQSAVEVADGFLSNGRRTIQPIAEERQESGCARRYRLEPRCWPGPWRQVGRAVRAVAL